MSAQPQQGPPPSPEAAEEQRLNELLEQVLGGDLPGAGYLFANDPEQRRASLVKSTPEFVRDAILSALETLAFDLQLPYGMVSKPEIAKAILAGSQAYLLLDPSVDETGVPVGAGAEAQGEAQVQAAEAQSRGQREAQQQKHEHELALEEQRHANAMELAAHQAALEPDPESFKRPEATGGHQEPPRVQPNAAEKKIEEAGKGKAAVLKGARGDRPLPRPRVGQ